MKLKYYINTNLLKLILLSFVVSLIFISSASAALLTSDITPNQIFKCQPAIISATFSDGGIVSVDAIVSTTESVLPGWQSGSNVRRTESTTVNLAFNGTFWVGTFGNNASLLWSTRSITYLVNGVTTYPSASTVLVYSDSCTGTGVTSYKNISSGLNMTYTDSLLSSNISFFDWLVSPYTNTMGVLFFFIIISIIVILTYMKSHNLISTMLVGILLVILVSNTNYIPTEYQGLVKILIALGLASLLIYIFVKRR